MKLIVHTWLIACVALVTVTAPQITLAQSVISDNDVARLRAFIGENDFDAKTPSGAGASAPSSSGGSVVNGVYKVRPGDTLSEIMAVHLGDTGVNHDVMQRVIVKNNKGAFRRGNPHWMMAGANLRMPTVTDVMDYVVPGKDSKQHSSSGEDWIRFP
jgi:Tfp pilus assembly protein FimV